jgi:hypothetical protein
MSGFLITNGQLLDPVAARVAIECKTIPERTLRRGFTTVRDAGGLDSGIQEARGSSA